MNSHRAVIVRERFFRRPPPSRVASAHAINPNRAVTVRERFFEAGDPEAG